MGMFNLFGVSALAHMVLLLTVCFFVLCALQKVEAKGLKLFGAMVAVLLGLSALLVFLAEVSSASAKRNMIGMMPSKQPCVSCAKKKMMMQQMMPQGQMMPGQEMLKEKVADTAKGK